MDCCLTYGNPVGRAVPGQFKAEPFALRQAMEVDGQIGVDEIDPERTAVSQRTGKIGGGHQHGKPARWMPRDDFHADFEPGLPCRGGCQRAQHRNIALIAAATGRQFANKARIFARDRPHVPAPVLLRD